MKPVVGQWVFGSELYRERMIPVRVACTRGQIVDIMEMTKEYYEQLDVLAYCVADEVISLSQEKR